MLFFLPLPFLHYALLITSKCATFPKLIDAYRTLILQVNMTVRILMCYCTDMFSNALLSESSASTAVTETNTQCDTTSPGKYTKCTHGLG